MSESTEQLDTSVADANRRIHRVFRWWILFQLICGGTWFLSFFVPWFRVLPYVRDVAMETCLVSIWIGLLLAQMMLLAGWITLTEIESQELPMKEVFYFTLLPAAAIFLLFPPYSCIASGFMLLLGLVIFLFSALPFGVLHQMIPRLPFPPINAPPRPLGQFSISQLMIVTTLCGASFALLRVAMMSQTTPFDFQEMQLWVMPLLCLWNAPPQLMRCFLGESSFTRRAIITTLLLHTLLLPTFCLEPRISMVLTLSYGAFVLMLVVHLIWMRHVGYRLVPIVRHRVRTNLPTLNERFHRPV